MRAGNRSLRPPLVAPRSLCRSFVFLLTASLPRWHESAKERRRMKIVIPDDYQDVVHRLACFRLLDGHEVVRYREPARDADELVARLQDADIVVEIRERVALS